MKTLLVIVIVTVELSVSVFAATITTPIQMVVDGVAYASERYAKANNGATPRDWSQLKQFVNMTVLDSQVGGSAEQRITLVASAALSDPKREMIVAVTTSPISEDRRDGLGRYVIWRKSGRYQTVWEREESVQKYLVSQGTAVPQGPVYKQPDVRPETATHDASEPMEVRPAARLQQARAIAQPAAMPKEVPAPTSTSVTRPPTIAPLPTTSIAGTPAVTAERQAPIWSWVVGIAVLIVIVSLVLKRRS